MSLTAASVVVAGAVVVVVGAVVVVVGAAVVVVGAAVVVVCAALVVVCAAVRVEDVVTTVMVEVVAGAVVEVVDGVVVVGAVPQSPAKGISTSILYYPPLPGRVLLGGLLGPEAQSWHSDLSSQVSWRRQESGL